MILPASRLHRSRAASALLLTLWAVGVLTLTIFVVVKLVEYDADDESFESKRVEARELALTGIALGLHPKIEPGDPLLKQTPAPNRQLEVTLESESARLAINRLLRTPSSPVLKDLFKFWGLDERETGVSVDSLYDWVDADDLRSLNGAERDDLVDQARYSIPRNRPFASVSEMDRVRGMDVVAINKPEWGDFFSVLSSGKIDINDAHQDLLMALGRLTEAQVKQWRRIRNGRDEEAGTEDDVRVSSMEEVVSLLALNGLQADAIQANFDVKSNPTRITSRATIGDVTYRITVVVARREGGGEQTFLSWEES